MRRRGFITLAGGAAAWPVVVRAQPLPMPVVGLLDPRSPDTVADRLRGFRQGPKDIGYVEGENATIAYRWAENQFDRLPTLAMELVRRQVAVIVASGASASVLAAKAATTSIPIVFNVNEDPVRLGLVASLARPGGNLTGINFFNGELAAKRLELLRALVPAAVHVAVLVNPTNVANTQSTLKDVVPAALAMGLQIHINNASTSREIDKAFETYANKRPDALFVGQDSLFNVRRLHLANMAARHAIPMSSGSRDIVEAGGLMSYGSNISDSYRQLGAYTGRILNGEKPEDLPVVQASKFELVINAQTARLLGIIVPPMLLARADEVIE